MTSSAPRGGVDGALFVFLCACVRLWLASARLGSFKTTVLAVWGRKQLWSTKQRLKSARGRLRVRRLPESIKSHGARAFTQLENHIMLAHSVRHQFQRAVTQTAKHVATRTRVNIVTVDWPTGSEFFSFLFLS